MLRRLFALALTTLAAVLLASAQPARAADIPTNDVTLDMENVVPLVYPFGLSVFNLYWDTDWDAHNPGFSRADIDAATTALTDSNYFDKGAQYGTPDLSFSGSAQAADFCGGTPGSTTSSVSLVLFLICEEATPFTGVPYSFANRIYNVIVPTGTTIDDFGSRSCTAYGAYHFIFPSLPAIPFGIPPPGRPIIFTVIPAACVSDVSGLMASISHEDIEAATDPTPLLHWIDFSTVDSTSLGSFFGSVLNPLKAGEASDICENGVGFQHVPVTFGGIPMEVESYWSNADNACVVGPSRVVFTRFQATGLSGVTGHVTVNGVTQTLPDGETLLEGATFSFPDVVTDGAGVRFIHPPGACSGTVAFPVGNTTADAATTITCAYTTEYFLTVNTSPAAAAVGNATLTPSGWHTSGSVVALSADADVPAGAGSRYDFRAWQVNGFPSGASVTMTGPKTATAVYQLQHRVDFVEAGIPANGTGWHVTIDGALQPGPAFTWIDHGTAVSYSYETPVADALDPAKRYVLSGVAPPSPLAVLAPGTVTGTYGTQYLLTVRTSGLGTNTMSVRNGVSLLGTATDAAPLAVFLPLGTVLSLNVDDPVNGTGGTQYFFQTFSPAPPGMLTSGFTTTANYETMSQQIDDALAGGGIQQQRGAGVAGALKQQWAAVEADLAAGNFAQALSDIESFVAHLAAQSGKKVTIATARELRLDAANVYLYALCRAVALGQINATTHATKYAYYSALVTSLGGTPLPDC